MKIWYLPLEPYRERYTEQLLEWTVRAFNRLRIDHLVIPGDVLSDATTIRTGPVLDARGRAHWALTQMARLVTYVNVMQKDDWIFCEDLFTPGYEVLPYIFDQLGWKPRIATRNYAQSVDPDDFTFAMRKWMRPFEQLVGETATVIFLASTVQKEQWEAANLPGRLSVIGLPFDSSAVRAQREAALLPWSSRKPLVVYSSRLDREKQPHFFMDIVEEYQASWSELYGQKAEFVFCTGAEKMRSNDESALQRLARLAMRGDISIRSGLTKREYYGILGDARVQLNTARQDFISFTAIEASTFAVPTLAPAFRSFPEALENRTTQLYVPWSVSDATAKLDVLLREGEPSCVRLAEQQDQTFSKMGSIFYAPAE